VEQRLRSVKGLTENLKAKLWDLRFAPTTTEAPAAEPADPYDANALTKVVGAGRSFLGGIGQGVASTVLHGGDLIRDAAEYFGAEPQPRPLDDPNVQAAITPYNTASKVGFATEQVGEFALPGGAVAKGVTKVAKTGKALAALPKNVRVASGVANAAKSGVARIAAAAPKTTNAAAQAATAYGVATAQQGDVEAGVVPAVIAAATPGVGALARTGAEALVKRVLPLSAVQRIQTAMPNITGRLRLPANAPQEAKELAEALATAKPPAPMPGNTEALKDLYAKQQQAVESVLKNRLRGNAGDVARIERNSKASGGILSAEQMRNSVERCRACHRSCRKPSPPTAANR
jgi:hypothetical protein